MTRSRGILSFALLVGACGDDGGGTTLHTFDEVADAAVCADVEDSCGDHRDDDCDTRVDCADDECASSSACTAAPCTGPPVPEACWDDWDDDCDGLPDCADVDCAHSEQCYTSCRCIPGAVRWCEAGSGGVWGRQTCDADASWEPCAETTERPGGCAGVHYDPTSCAAAAGACCQDAPASGSIGACDAVIRCP